MKCIASLIILMSLFPLPAGIAQQNDLVKPVLIERPEPVLTASLRKTNAKGIVIAKIEVSSKGKVENIEFIKGSNLKEFDNFLIKWIKKWKYLPRTDRSSITTGYTVITLKYDLGEGKIDAPSVVSAPLQIPESVLSVTGEDHANGAGLEDIKPLKPLKINSIPIDIQNLAVQQKVLFILQINEQGVVQDVKVEPAIENQMLFDWFKTYFNGVGWDLSDGLTSFPVLVGIDVEFNTAICKFEFGSVQIMHEFDNSRTNQ